MAIPDPTPFESLDELRAEHGRLLRRSKEPARQTGEPAGELAGEVVGFLGRVRATGVRLDAPTDREAAQSILDYWTATLFTLPNGLAAANALPSVLPGVQAGAVNLQLLPFDPATLGRATAAADAWLQSQSADDQALARRVVLRLTRLYPDRDGFDPVPTVRAALYDLDAPERVNAVVSGLAATGVVRVTPGESGDMDRVALRSPELLRSWKALEDWQADRLRFRAAAVAWDRAGRSADLLAGDDPTAASPGLEEARRYHDRNHVEREYVNASAYRQARKLEQAEADRRAKLLWRGLAAVAVLGLIGTVVGAVVSVRAESQRAEAETRRAKADTLRAEAERERAEYEGQVSRGELITLKDHVDEVNRDLAIRKSNQQLANMTRVIRALAELGTTSGEERRVAQWRWDGIVNSLRGDQDLQEYLARYKVELDNLRPVTNDDKQFRQFAHKALNVARSLKAEAEAGDPGTIRTLSAMRKVAYELVEQVTGRTVDLYGNSKPSFTDAAPLVREFWILYWGEMGLFEGDNVATAMRDFGNKLKEIEAHVSRQMLAEDKQLTDDDRKLLSGQGITQALGEWKNRSDRRDEFVRLTNALLNRPIPGKLIGELRDLRAALVKELKAELRLGGGAATAPLPTAY